MNESNSVERPVVRPQPDGKDFRALIDWHMENGTCYICSKPVDHSEGYHGGTGAHWDCVQQENKKTEEAFARVDQGFLSIGIKPKRRREGEGRTAQKCKAMAVAAIEEALGVRLYDITIWNQQGAYRGPRWDLDAWGLTFWFDRDGHRFSGDASSLPTMTQCLKFKRLRAVKEDLAHSFSLWEYRACPNTDNNGKTDGINSKL